MEHGRRNDQSESVRRLEARMLRIPLSHVYKGSSVDLHVLESILVEVWVGDRSALGETCPFSVYSGLPASVVWEQIRQALPSLLGATPAEGLGRLEALRAESGGFSVVAMSSALEKLQDADALSCPSGGTVPLIGTLLAADEADLERELEGLRDQGHSEFKVKVGYGADGGRSKLERLQRRMRDGELLRIDANGAFKADDALELCSVMRRERVRYFEQPLEADDWPGLRRLGGRTGIPVMLDESIRDTRDIEMAAEVPNVDYVKLKLMKSGSASQLMAAAEFSRSLGLHVILGNGVASDVGCADEAALHLKLQLTLAGEMNGFVKTRVPVVANPLTVVDGKMVLPGSYYPKVLGGPLENYTTASCVVC